MKKLFFYVSGLVALALFSGSTSITEFNEDDQHDKESMRVVMRFELKVQPESVDLLKKSFDACKAEVLAKEPGCLDYSLFQSYNDSTLFCITETWATKEDHNKHMKLDHTLKHLAETRGIRDPSFQSPSSYMYWVCPEVNEIR